MKKGSKTKFDNILLKRWLLQVGPVRRKILLTKFRADLVRLGLPTLAWREGLLQLSSRPFVPLIREANIITQPKPRKGLMQGPKSRKKEAQAINDNNNNNNNNKDLMGQEFGRVTSSSSNKERRKNDNRQNIPKLDFLDHHSSDRGSSSAAASSSVLRKHISTIEINKSKKRISKTGGESEKKSSSAGSERSIKDREKLKERQKKYRIPKKGENPNAINWRLIPIDMEIHTKSPDLKLLRLRQIDKKKKKDRLYAKFLEIFGEDIDPTDKDVSSFTNSSTKTHETCKTSSNSKKTVTHKERIETQGKAETSRNRKSPTFDNLNKRKRRDSHKSVEKNSLKKSKTGNIDTRKESISSDTTALDKERDYLLDILQDGDLSIDSMATIADPVHSNQRIVNSDNPVVGEIDLDENTMTSVSTEILERDKQKDSKSSQSNCQRLERIRRKTLDLGLISDSDNESVQTTIALPISEKRTSLQDRQSVVQATSTASVTPESETKILNISDDDDNRSVIEIPLDDKKSEIRKSAESLISSRDKMLKTETADESKKIVLQTILSDKFPPPLPNQEPFLTSSNINCSSDVHENDPKPSSTTADTESVNNTIGENEIRWKRDKLLGALDNIYLALDCRRRIRERKEIASKLAVERNRQEEISKAKKEFESKLTIFREEISYLFRKLDTWDSVLRFISNGLDNRTPNGVKPFSPAEVELAMLEAEIKVPFNINIINNNNNNNDDNDEKQLSGDIAKIKSTPGKVICTIDLTLDNKEDDGTIDLCDSSTDPPRSKNYSVFQKTKFEPVTVEDVDHFKCGQEFSKVFDDNDIGEGRQFPSITEVKTISSQQFEKIDNSSSEDEDPCYLCSKASTIACGLCARAPYCSKKCQETHWKQSHHITCVPLKGIIFPKVNS